MLIPREVRNNCYVEHIKRIKQKMTRRFLLRIFETKLVIGIRYSYIVLLNINFIKQDKIRCFLSY